MISEQARQIIETFDHLVQSGEVMNVSGELYTGVDLGTAYVVLCVINEAGQPVAAVSQRASVVRDGVVSDYTGAIEIVRRLKTTLEGRIGRPLKQAAAAIPPGVGEGSYKAIVNVVEACDFEMLKVVDEPTAAALLLQVTDGAVIDVGGGTTGISLLEGGRVTYTADEPTGGHHMNLVLAGRYQVSYEEAEQIKHDKARDSEVFQVVVPVVEKMAAITAKAIAEGSGGKAIRACYVVGGATSFKAFERTFEKVLKIQTIKPPSPMLVTPIGIALSCTQEVDLP